MLYLISDNVPHVRKLHYFIDSASSLYKGRKNFLNLCYPEDDFHVAAE
jgi:hypothetical protein